MENSKILENIIKKREDEYKEIEKELETLKAPFNDFIRMLKIILKATEANTAEEIEEIFDTFPPIENEEHEELSEDTDDPLMPLKDILTENKIKDIRNTLISLDVALPLMRIFIHQVKKKPKIINKINCYFESLNITPLNRKEAFEYLHTLQYKERIEILSITSNASKLDIHISNNNFEGFEQELSKTEKGTDEMLKTISIIKQLETQILIIQEGILLSMHNNDEDAEIMFRHLEGKINKIKHLSPEVYDAAQSKINEEFSLYKICISNLTVIVDFLSEASIKHIRNIICKDEYTSILRPIHLEIIKNPVFSMVSRKELHIKRSRDLMTKIYGSDCTEVKTATEALNDLNKKKEVGRKKDVWNVNIKGREVDFGSFLKENIWDILIEDLDKEILISSYGEKKKSKINEEQREKTIKQIALALICSCLCGDKIKITSSFLTTAEVLTETSRNTLKKYIEIFTAINSIKTFSHSKGIKKKIKSLDDYEENELKKGTANNIQKEILKQVSNTSCRTILEQNIKTLYNLMLKYKVLLNEQTTEFLFD